MTRPKPGRRRLDPRRREARRLTIRYGPEELRILRAAAKRWGCGLAEAVRKKIRGRS